MSTNLVTGKSKKQKQLSEMISCLMNNLLGTKGIDEGEELINTVFKAKQEMNDAQCYFDNVTAPELVDYAIYKLEAAKYQYTYLLKLAREKGLRMDI